MLIEELHLCCRRFFSTWSGIAIYHFHMARPNTKARMILEGLCPSEAVMVSAGAAGSMTPQTIAGHVNWTGSILKTSDVLVVVGLSCRYWEVCDSGYVSAIMQAASETVCRCHVDFFSRCADVLWSCSAARIVIYVMMILTCVTIILADVNRCSFRWHCSASSMYLLGSYVLPVHLCYMTNARCLQWECVMSTSWLTDVSPSAIVVFVCSPDVYDAFSLTELCVMNTLSPSLLCDLIVCVDWGHPDQHANRVSSTAFCCVDTDDFTRSGR